jgi:hypothetical protein
MKGSLEPEIERILPLLPLKDPVNLTPSRAREELVAMADARKDVPLPQPAAVIDLTVDGAAGSILSRERGCYRFGRILSRRRMGGWRLVHP